MRRYEFRGYHLTVNEISDRCGIAPHTLRDRLRRGYSIEQATKTIPVADSVQEFIEASYWRDWVGMPINDLYEIYWKWCVSSEHPVVSKQGFSRQLFTIHPQLHTVPMQGVRYIRMRGIK